MVAGGSSVVGSVIMPNLSVSKNIIIIIIIHHLHTDKTTLQLDLTIYQEKL
jgi:hypothetical protein